MTEDQENQGNLIKPYTKDWIYQFNNISKILLEALSSIDVKIEHIGSTSVPELAAKPIIDMDIVFQTYDDFVKIKERLLALGYHHNGDQGIPSREVFKRTKQEINYPILDTIQHHLYACAYDSQELNRHILFRNYLKESESARKEYQQLKFKIALEANQDKKLYAQLKEIKAKEFVESIIGLALKKNKPEK